MPSPPHLIVNKGAKSPTCYHWQPSHTLRGASYRIKPSLSITEQKKEKNHLLGAMGKPPYRWTLKSTWLWTFQLGKPVASDHFDWVFQCPTTKSVITDACLLWDTIPTPGSSSTQTHIALPMKMLKNWSFSIFLHFQGHHYPGEALVNVPNILMIFDKCLLNWIDWISQSTV